MRKLNTQLISFLFTSLVQGLLLFFFNTWRWDEIDENLSRQRRLQQALRHNQNELANRRRSRTAAENEYTRETQGLAEADINGQENKSYNESEFPRQEIEGAVMVHDAHAQTNNKETDDDTEPGIAPEKIGGQDEGAEAVLAMGIPRERAFFEDIGNDAAPGKRKSKKTGKALKIPKTGVEINLEGYTLKDGADPREEVVYRDSDTAAFPLPRKPAAKKTGKKSQEIDKMGAECDVEKKKKKKKKKRIGDVPREETSNLGNDTTPAYAAYADNEVTVKPSAKMTPEASRTKSSMAEMGVPSRRAGPWEER